MLAAGTRKYLLGIPGMAFLYVRKELADALKPKTSAWFGRESGFDAAYAKGARRFQTGTPAFVSIYAAAAALSLLNHIGVSHIRDHVKTICTDACQYAAEKVCSWRRHQQESSRAWLRSGMSGHRKQRRC